MKGSQPPPVHSHCDTEKLPAKRFSLHELLLVVVACMLALPSPSALAQDGVSAPQEVPSAETGEGPQDAEAEIAGMRLPAPGRFQPLLPADTSGPRETITDLLRRVEAMHGVVMAALNSYLQSDRLYASDAEQRNLQRVMEMANVAVRAMEFERLPVAIESPEYRGRMLLTLKDLLDRLKLPPMEEIPTGAQMLAAGTSKWRVPGTEIEIHRVDGGAREGEWLFTSETVLQLPEWHRRASALPYQDTRTEGMLARYKFGPFGLLDIVPLRWMLGMPPWLKAQVADQPVWRWIGLFLVMAGCALIFFMLRLFANRLERDADTGSGVANWVDAALPLCIALLVIFVREVATHILRFSAPVYAPMMITLATALYLTVIWIIWTTGRAIAETVIVSRRLKTWSMDGQLIRLAIRFLALVLSVAVLVEGANRIGLPAYSVVAGLGVGGIAVALAARETLANLMGSFTLMIEKPFRVGHWVRIGNDEGMVEAVGFRSTRIRTFYDSLVSVPSSKLMESTIDNMGVRKFRRVKTTISVKYDTPPELLRKFVEAVREIIATHPHARKDNYHVYLNDFADSSLEVLLYFFLEVPDWAAELRQREDVLLRIIECADHLGVEFAFPTRTLHIAENHPHPMGTADE